MGLRVATALVLTVLVLLGFASVAAAGRYHVYSCRTPGGEAAPADGWTSSKSGTYTYTADTCGLGGALMAALGDQPLRTANTDFALWAFATPTPASLVGATLWRAGDTAGCGALDAAYQFSVSSPVETSAVDRCGAGLGCSGAGEFTSPFAPSNRLPVTSEKLGGHIYVRSSCGGQAEYECPQGQGDANGYAAVVYLYAADLVLEQTAGPSADSVGGELASGQNLIGEIDLSFRATDPGAGVYEAVFSVDGQVVQRTVIDGNGGRCRDAGETSDGIPAFLYLQPCPGSVSADVGFDTTRVANGSHHLVVSVLDAAGNSAPVLDRMVTFANPGVPGPANGTGASAQAVLSARWQSTPHAVLTDGFQRGATISGRLIAPGGRPISGAQIEVRVTPSFSGASSSSMKDASTGPDGRFAVRIPAGVSSRAVTLAYREHIGDPAPVAARTLRLAVRAPVSLRIAPRTAAVGSTIHFTGRLAGGPIPRGGKPLVLEARSGGSRWIEFDVVRSDRRGRFHSSYTFRFPGPAVYQFRVLCEQEADYPYARGASRIVRIDER